uniref:Uncharacterized protein n=1 Tax=viral metagenome TaxID=1070528 RepID=A0A6C0BR82_9ZZZZ
MNIRNINVIKAIMYFLNLNNDDCVGSLGIISKRDALISYGKPLRSVKNCLRPVSSVNGL